MTRLKERYLKDVVPALAKEFGYKNVMAIPKLEKIVVNMGLGEATQNVKLIDAGADEVGADHRPAVGDDPRQEVDRGLQGAQGHAGRRRWSRCAATGCTSSSTAC